MDDVGRLAFRPHRTRRNDNEPTREPFSFLRYAIKDMPAKLIFLDNSKFQGIKSNLPLASTVSLVTNADGTLIGRPDF